MRVEWSPRAIRAASLFLENPEELTVVLAAVDALADDPYPPESFRWGQVRRLRVGRYRVMYVVEGDLITIDRVGRVADGGA